MRQPLSPSFAGRGNALLYDCPEPELLADYLEGVSSDRERQEIEAHMADCRDCRRIVALIVRSEAAVPDPIPIIHQKD